MCEKVEDAKSRDGGGGRQRPEAMGRDYRGLWERKRDSWEKREGSPWVINFLVWEHPVCCPAGMPTKLAGKEGSLKVSRSHFALLGLAGRGWGFLPGAVPYAPNPAGLQPRPEPVRNLSGARREGGFVSSKDTSKAKNYIPGRPKYACLEKLLAFMKSLVRKAGLQMTASERQ